MQKMTPEMLEKAKAMYESGESFASMSKHFPVKACAIGLLFRKNKIPVRRSWDACSKNRSRNAYYKKVDEQFFSRPLNPISAYWLGFLLADGTVDDKGVITLQLHSKDENHIGQFRGDISSEHEIRYRMSEKTGQLHVYIRIGSRKLSDQLIELECVPRKSLIHGFPSLPEELQRDVIRGYYDGDGGICCDRRGRWSVYFAGSSVFLDRCQTIILEKCGVYLNRNSRGRLGILRGGGRQKSEAFLDWLYNGAERYLKRKYDHYLEMKNTNNLRKTGALCLTA